MTDKNQKSVLTPPRFLVTPRLDVFLYYVHTHLMDVQALAFATNGRGPCWGSIRIVSDRSYLLRRSMSENRSDEAIRAAPVGTGETA